MEQTIVLVTGGSRGLGRDMVLNLAKRGHNIILTYNSNKEEAGKVVAEVAAMGRKVAALQLNAGDSKTFDAFFAQVKTTLKDQFGTEQINHLVNNAGTALYAPIAQTTEEQFDEIVNIHFKGVYFLTQKALAILADGGSIVNVSSGLARFATPGSSAYASAKGAIEVFTRYLAKELGSKGIRANVVAPGAIETDFGGGRVRDNKELNTMIASQTALGRVGLPTDIGSVVAFLCSDDAKWVTAQRIEASGGMYL